jgi:hypothetical protein
MPCLALPACGVVDFANAVMRRNAEMHQWEVERADWERARQRASEDVEHAHASGMMEARKQAQLTLAEIEAKVATDRANNERCARLPFFWFMEG